MKLPVICPRCDKPWGDKSRSISARNDHECGMRCYGIDSLGNGVFQFVFETHDFITWFVNDNGPMATISLFNGKDFHIAVRIPFTITTDQFDKYLVLI